MMFTLITFYWSAMDGHSKREVLEIFNMDKKIYQIFTIFSKIEFLFFFIPLLESITISMICLMYLSEIWNWKHIPSSKKLEVSSKEAIWKKNLLSMLQGFAFSSILGRLLSVLSMFVIWDY